MRQIVYVSLSSVPGDGADLSGILNQSRQNNAIDGITGLLWSDGKSFLQVIEGPRVSIEACFERIQRDTRPYHVSVLSDRRIISHEFGTWNTIHRRKNESAGVYKAQIRRLLYRTSDEVRAHFIELVDAAALTILPGAQAAAVNISAMKAHR